MQTNTSLLAQELLEFTNNKSEIYYALFTTLNQEERAQLANALEYTPLFDTHSLTF